MKNLLVTGADGQLGHFVRQALGANDEVMFSSRADLDLSSQTSIKSFFDRHGEFRTILNLAAFTAVDLAEKERDLAWQVNGVAPAELGVYCDRIIHISTDYVFDGEKKAPYSENDTAHPLCQYGASKHEGELQLLQGHSHAVVVRTSWLYSELPGNFLTKILGFARTKPELKIVADQFGSPTYAGDLAEVLVRMVKNGAAPGLYHYCNEGVTTWHEFAEFFVRESGLSTPVLPITTADFPVAAKRPQYSAMNCSKIKRELNISINPWRESVKVCLKRLKN